MKPGFSCRIPPRSTRLYRLRYSCGEFRRGGLYSPSSSRCMTNIFKTSKNSIGPIVSTVVFALIRRTLKLILMRSWWDRCLAGLYWEYQSSNCVRVRVSFSETKLTFVYVSLGSDIYYLSFPTDRKPIQISGLSMHSFFLARSRRSPFRSVLHLHT